MKQTSDENKAKYKLEDYLLINYQFLQYRSWRIVWQTVRRITNEIMGVNSLPETGKKKLTSSFMSRDLSYPVVWESSQFLTFPKLEMFYFRSHIHPLPLKFCLFNYFSKAIPQFDNKPTSQSFNPPTPKEWPRQKISLQSLSVQTDRWWELRIISVRWLLVDPIPNSPT